LSRVPASLFTAASLLTLCATAATAQPVDGEVEALIVTAQKREQAIIDVPMALTAFSGARLERLGVQELDDLAVLTPGLEVQRQSPNNAGFVMRGITSQALEATAEPRVSLFQDGVSISKGEGAYVELFDLERIEVVKGPQSTLFGRGALIGAIQILQNKASPDGLVARFGAEVGSYDSRMVEGALNVPLSERFAVRFAGRAKRRDGYVENALGGPDFQSTHTDAARVSFAYRRDRTDADLILNYQRDLPSGTAFKSLVLDPANPVSGAILAPRKLGAPAALASPADSETGTTLGLDRTIWSATLLATHELSDTLTLNSVSGFRHYQSLESNDVDGAALPILSGINAGKAEQWSQELRLNYDAGGRLSWFLGAGAFGFQGDHRLGIQFDERLLLAGLARQLNGAAAGTGLAPGRQAPLALLTSPLFGGALLQGLVAAASDNSATAPIDPQATLSAAQAQAIFGNLRANQREFANDLSDLESFDLFGDLSYALTDRLELSLGLRYTHDDKTTGFRSFVPQGRSVLAGALGAAQLAAQGTPQARAQAQALLGALQSPAVHQLPASVLPQFGLTFQPTANNGDLEEATNEDQGLTWRAAARYAVNDDLNVFASYARGRRPEVLAATPPQAPFGPVRFARIDAETVDSVEVGLKGRSPELRLGYDLAAYAYRYENFETLLQQGARLVPSNAGKARSYGVEAQVDWAATPSFDLLAGYAYSHGRFSSGAFDGNRFRQAPDHTLSVSASWRLAVPGGELDVRPSVSWQSKSFFDDNNDRPDLQTPPSSLVPDVLLDEVQDAYGLVNLRLVYQPAAENFSIELFGTNLTDEAYIIDAGNAGDVIGLPTAVAGAPRMVGLRLRLWTP
jgi:outer membrane receptor protein involved in Fe transport